jgi:SAM-dependent methyltransferase
MKNELLDVLACPSCGGGALGLTVREERESSVAEGDLHCPGCRRTYPVTEAVPRLVDRDELRRSPSKSFGYQWLKWLKGGFEQQRIYGSDLGKEMKEFFQYTGLGPDELKGKRVLDAGCGSGRLTRELGARGARVVGMDVHAAVAEVQRACDPRSDVAIVQGSILKPPLRERSFDLVWSEGVIHHTGNTPGAFDQLAHLVKPGGRLFVWVYWSEERPIYRRVRNRLKIMHKLPMPALFAFCYALAAVLYLGALLRGLPGTLTGSRKVTPLQLHAFRLFDHLSPAHNTQHGEAEVRGWFERSGFTNVVRVADLGVRGDKLP